MQCYSENPVSKPRRAPDISRHDSGILGAIIKYLIQNWSAASRLLSARDDVYIILARNNCLRPLLMVP